MSDKEKIIKIISDMAVEDMKVYEGKGDYGPLKMKSRTAAVKHHRRARVYARIVARINKEIPEGGMKI